MRRAAAIVLAAFAAFRSAAEPAGWTVDAADSAIAFEYRLAGTLRQGAFTAIAGEGDFDPADPAATRLTLRIPADGLELGNPLETAFAKSVEWFDVAAHPEAVYRLDSLAPDSAGGWTARGTLTIKGRTVALDTPLALALGPARAVAEGALAVNRRDFDLGLGLSDAVLDIADGVTVRFAVVARPLTPGVSPP